MRRTTGFEFSVSDYVRDGLVRPIVCALPVVAFSTILCYSDWLTWVSGTLSAAATLLTTVYLVWHWGLVGAEREKLMAARLVPQA
jgi:hypothetical protein